jgi:hypothetical protein
VNQLKRNNFEKKTDKNSPSYFLSQFLKFSQDIDSGQTLKVVVRTLQKSFFFSFSFFSTSLLYFIFAHPSLKMLSILLKHWKNKSNIIFSTCWVFNGYWTKKKREEKRWTYKKRHSKVIFHYVNIAQFFKKLKMNCQFKLKEWDTVAWRNHSIFHNFRLTRRLSKRRVTFVYVIWWWWWKKMTVNDFKTLEKKRSTS